MDQITQGSILGDDTDAMVDQIAQSTVHGDGTDAVQDNQVFTSICTGVTALGSINV